MTRKLFIIRHGSAEPHSWDEDDFLRKLTPMGIKEVIETARKFQGSFSWMPEHILCSDANRTKETFQNLKNTMNFKPDVVLCSSFYLGGVNEVLGEIEKVKDGVMNLLLIGHNPTFSELASQLSGELISLSPANAVVLEKQCSSWAQAVHEEGWELIKFLSP
ncbi:MAG: hypothetical protein HRU09_17410 [Oligoflexales bacterium]|nr:hypothetical protein [Oligoflexales bacterium]